MGTRSTINLELEDGTIKSIYCHWDGYPDHHLPILEEQYNTFEKVKALIDLGDLSVLDVSIECPEGHYFKTPIPGYCVAYGRDRGELNTQARTCICVQDIDKQSYNYLFKNGTWELI